MLPHGILTSTGNFEAWAGKGPVQESEGTVGQARRAQASMTIPVWPQHHQDSMGLCHVSACPTPTPLVSFPQVQGLLAMCGEHITAEEDAAHKVGRGLCVSCPEAPPGTRSLGL